MAKVYTIKDAIEELESIRLEANKIVDRSNRELPMLISELASVMGWLARHIDQKEMAHE